MNTIPKSERPMAGEHIADKQTHNNSEFGTNASFRKTLTTLQAQFALQGFTLELNHHSDELEVTYWICRWDQSRSFKRLEDVRAFLVLIGGATW